jgi:hypothetical protein
MHFKITVQELEKLLNYLESKPYVEVFQFITLLQNLPKTEEKKEEDNGQ